MDKEKHNINNNLSKELIEKINKTYSKHKDKAKTDNANSTETDSSASNAHIEELNKKIVELEKANQDISQKNEEFSNKYAELEDMLKRRVAEFENFKRRTDKEKIELLEYGNIKLLSRFIDLLDDFKNANQAANATDDVPSIVKGLEMIYQKTTKLFNDEGVLLIETNIGDEFDVEKHEALMQQHSDLPEGSITMILQDGYTYKGKVLRYVKVATSSGNAQ